MYMAIARLLCAFEFEPELDWQSDDEPLIEMDELLEGWSNPDFFWLRRLLRLTVQLRLSRMNGNEYRKIYLVKRVKGEKSPKEWFRALSDTTCLKAY